MNVDEENMIKGFDRFIALHSDKFVTDYEVKVAADFNANTIPYLRQKGSFNARIYRMLGSAVGYNKLTYRAGKLKGQFISDIAVQIKVLKDFEEK